MNRKITFSIAVLIFAILACSTLSPNTVVGSGKAVSETRNVSGFSSIELRGSADVTATIGSAESVTVKGDDNIVPLITTTVSNGALIIETKPLTNINVSNPIQVSVTMKLLQGITLSGSGNINVSGMDGGDLSIDLPGSGDITVKGTADNLTLNLLGSGNIVCDELKASSATITLNGSGNIDVFVSDSLDANIRGSGTIHYAGNPAQVHKNVTGSGSITP